MGAAAEDRQELKAALDEVESQLREMSTQEVLADEELEWSIGAVFVVARVVSTSPVVLELEASRGLLRRVAQTRTVTLD